MDDFYLEELKKALKLLPLGTMWAVGSMEEGPFARLVIPNLKAPSAWDYVESCEEAHTVPQAIRKALFKYEHTISDRQSAKRPNSQTSEPATGREHSYGGL